MSFFQRLYNIFLFSFQRNSSPLYFIFRFSSFFCYPPQCRHLDLVQKKQKAYSDLLSFFLSKSLGGHAIYRQKRAGARNANFLSALMKGWTYVRPYVRVRDFDRTNFFTHGALLDSSSIISLKLFTKRRRQALLLCFFSKILGGHAIYRQKRAGARNANFLPAFMKGWTYERVRDFVVLS